MNILDNVSESKAGRLSVIPLDEVSNNKNEKRTFPKSKHVIDSAKNLIKCDPKYSSVVDLLVGNVLLVDDIKAAIVDKDLVDWILIDLKGVMYNSHVLSSPRSSKGTTIGRKEKIKSLQKQIDELSNANNEIENNLWKKNPELKFQMLDKLFHEYSLTRSRFPIRDSGF